MSDSPQDRPDEADTETVAGVPKKAPDSKDDAPSKQDQ